FSRDWSSDVCSSDLYETFFFDSSENKRCIEIHHSPYCFGGISVLLNRTKALKSVVAKKGTMVYSLPRKEFLDLCDAYDDFFQYYTTDFGRRMLDEEFSHFVKTPASFEERSEERRVGKECRSRRSRNT